MNPHPFAVLGIVPELNLTVENVSFRKRKAHSKKNASRHKFSSVEINNAADELDHAIHWEAKMDNIYEEIFVEQYSDEIKWVRDIGEWQVRIIQMKWDQAKKNFEEDMAAKDKEAANFDEGAQKELADIYDLRDLELPTWLRFPYAYAIPICIWELAYAYGRDI
ncbi:hypothetical protein ACMFMF_006526 [Clarireedia jacksonii]